MGDRLFKLAERDMKREWSKAKMEPVHLPSEMVEPPSKNVLQVNAMLRCKRYNQLREDGRHRVLEGKAAEERVDNVGAERAGSEWGDTDAPSRPDMQPINGFGMEDPAFDEIEFDQRLNRVRQMLSPLQKRMFDTYLDNTNLTQSALAIQIGTSEDVVQREMVKIRVLVQAYENLHESEEK